MTEENQTYDEGPSFVWAFLGFFIFALDFFLRFGGMNFGRFKDLLFSGSWRIYINAITLILIISYLILIKDKQELDVGEIAAFAGLAVFISIIFSMGVTTYVGAVIHLIFAIAFFFGVLIKVMDRKQAILLLLIALFADFFLFSIFNINKLVFPIWLLLALIFIKPSRLKSWAIFIVILFYLFHSFGAVTTYYGTPQMINGKDIQDFVEFSKISWQNTKEFFVSLKEGTLSGFRKQKNITQAMVFGDYYTGQVDENVQQQLGVSIIEVQSTDPYIYEDEPITMYARIQARTLKDPITIKNFCHAESVLPDSIKPESETITQYQDLTIDCMFDSCRFSPGSKSIYFNIDFSFQTMSYLRNYFIDKERMQTLIMGDPNIRSPSDILTNFGILDAQPIALSTNGPIKIGMELEKSQPVSIDRNRDAMSFRLGLTLENMWEGKIKNVKDLTIILPGEMSLELDGNEKGTYCGGYMFDAKSCLDVFGEEGEQWCDNTESKIYQINQEGINQRIIPAGQPGIDLYKSLICRLSLEKNKYDNFLGSAPISTKNFKVVAEYDYELQRSSSINIRKSEYDGCAGTVSEDEIGQYECQWLQTPDKANLPPLDFQNRYKNYQNNIKSLVKNYRLSGLNEVQAEALIAAIISEASRVGEIDENDNGIPDYVAGFGVRFPDVFLDNPRKDLDGAVKYLQGKTLKDDTSIRAALVQYEGDLNVDNIMKYYTQWKNVLCKGEETDTGDEDISTEDNIPFATLFKKDDLIGVDKDQNAIWTNNDDYYFIEGFKKGADGSWVYRLSASKISQLNQMKIDAFEYKINGETNSYPVWVQRPATKPADWESLIFNPLQELREGVIV